MQGEGINGTPSESTGDRRAADGGLITTNNRVNGAVAGHAEAARLFRRLLTGPGGEQEAMG